MRDYTSFRTVYCGLCRALGKRYALGMRLILTYDMTILAALLLSLRESAPVADCRCPAKLGRRCPTCVEGETIPFAADCSVLLFYHKMRDNLHDSSLRGRVLAVLLYPFASWMARWAAKRQPQAAKRIAEAMSRQRAAETAGAGIDAAAEPTAAMMRDLLLMGSGGRADTRVVGRLGYFLGRWVYLMDATDDLKQDIKTGDYNPFAKAWNVRVESDCPAARGRAAGLLNVCVHEIQVAYALMPSGPYAPVLENTFDYGLPEMQRAVVEELPARPAGRAYSQRERKMDKHG